MLLPRTHWGHYYGFLLSQAFCLTLDPEEATLNDNKGASEFSAQISHRANLEKKDVPRVSSMARPNLLLVSCEDF